MFVFYWLEECFSNVLLNENVNSSCLEEIRTNGGRNTSHIYYFST